MPLSKIQDIGNQVIPNLGRRNLIINGAFQVFQRGTTQTGTANGVYGSADRFLIYGNGQTFSRSTDVPSNSGLSYSLTTTGTPSSEYQLAQAIELQDAGIAGQFYVGQQITVSYYAKSSSAGDRLWNGLIFRTGVSSSSNQVLVDFDNTDNNTLTTSFQRFSKTYTIGSGVTPHSTNDCLVVQIRSRNSAQNSSTPDGNITITGIQVEIGSSASDFEHRLQAEELKLCQRYYFNPWKGTARRGYQVNGFRHGSGWIFSMNFPNTMRAIPTITFTGSPDNSIGINSIGGGVSSRPTADWTASSISEQGTRIAIGWTGTYNTGDPGAVTNNENTATMNVDAEL